MDAFHCCRYHHQIHQNHHYDSLTSVFGRNKMGIQLLTDNGSRIRSSRSH